MCTPCTAAYTSTIRSLCMCTTKVYAHVHVHNTHTCTCTLLHIILLQCRGLCEAHLVSWWSHYARGGFFLEACTCTCTCTCTSWKWFHYWDFGHPWRRLRELCTLPWYTRLSVHFMVFSLTSGTGIYAHTCTCTCTCTHVYTRSCYLCVNLICKPVPPPPSGL